MKQKIYKILRLLGLLCLLRKLKGKKITVLCFHRVSDEHSPSWPPLKIGVFEQMLVYIKKHYDVIGLKDLDKVALKGKPKLILTFDDGYKDFITNTLPLLKKYNLPACINVVVGSIETDNLIWTQRLNKIIEAYLNSNKPVVFADKNYIVTAASISSVSAEIFLKLLEMPGDIRKLLIDKMENNVPSGVYQTEMLNWEDLKLCMNNGIEVGSHTMTHFNLSQSADLSVLNYEILNSGEILKEKLNYEPSVIAFPNGQYNQETLSLSQKAGYKYLLLVDEQLYDLSKSDIKAYYAIPRILIQHETFIENCFKIENFHNLVKSLRK